jgi:hypothetical protein
MRTNVRLRRPSAPNDGDEKGVMGEDEAGELRFCCESI